MIHNQICPWCNHSIQPIDVHGHSQCQIAKLILIHAALEKIINVSLAQR